MRRGLAVGVSGAGVKVASAAPDLPLLMIRDRGCLSVGLTQCE